MFKARFWYWSDFDLILLWYFLILNLILNLIWYWSVTDLTLIWYWSVTDLILIWYWSDTDLILNWYLYIGKISSITENYILLSLNIYMIYFLWYSHLWKMILIDSSQLSHRFFIILRCFVVYINTIYILRSKNSWH